MDHWLLWVGSFLHSDLGALSEVNRHFLTFPQVTSQNRCVGTYIKTFAHQHVCSLFMCSCCHIFFNAEIHNIPRKTGRGSLAPHPLSLVSVLMVISKTTSSFIQDFLYFAYVRVNSDRRSKDVVLRMMLRCQNHISYCLETLGMESYSIEDGS